MGLVRRTVYVGLDDIATARSVLLYGSIGFVIIYIRHNIVEKTMLNKQKQSQ